MTPPLLDPPEAFSHPAVLCPSCGHGIDAHSPVDTCKVGDVNRVLCECRWSPNDIAGKLADALNDAQLYENEARDALARQTPVSLVAEAKLAKTYDLATEICAIILSEGPGRAE